MARNTPEEQARQEAESSQAEPKLAKLLGQWLPPKWTIKHVNADGESGGPFDIEIYQPCGKLRAIADLKAWTKYPDLWGMLGNIPLGYRYKRSSAQNLRDAATELGCQQLLIVSNQDMQDIRCVDLQVRQWNSSEYGPFGNNPRCSHLEMPLNLFGRVQGELALCSVLLNYGRMWHNLPP